MVPFWLTDVVVHICGQASYITGGVYLKPQVSDGLFQYLSVSVVEFIKTQLSLACPV